MKLFADVETASLCNLTKAGAWAYSRHPSTHTYCMAFLWDDEEECYVWFPGGTLDARIVDHVRRGGRIVAHNYAFEHAIWTNVLVPRFGFPEMSVHQWDCTQALALSLNLPYSLAGLGAVLGCDVQKDDEGAELMKEMAKDVVIDGKGFSYPSATVTNLWRLRDYCITDVLTTRECYDRLLPMSTIEKRLWRVDQTINARGVYLDREFAKKCQLLAQQRSKVLDDVAFRVTQGEVNSSSAPPALKKWLKSLGVVLPKRVRGRGDHAAVTDTLDNAAMKLLLDGDDLPPDARTLLEHRQEAARVTSLAKLDRVLAMSDPDDGRLRNGLQFRGTHTGRWASYGLQLHNLPKVKLTTTELRLARAIANRGDIALLGMMFDRPLQALSQLLRSVIAAPPGKDLIAGDYSAIEARVVAWLAGQSDVLELFRAGADVYTYAANNVGSDDRQLGKVQTLALGYQMGALRFHTTAAAWGVNLSLKEARRITLGWREKNDAIARFWTDLGDAARAAVINRRGAVFRAGRITCHATANALMITLPSGRVLRYWKPSLATSVKKVRIINEAGKIETIEVETQEIRYYVVGPNRSIMVPESTYGGKLVENVTQAVACDLLGDALLRFDEHPLYDVVIHVHDSLGCEVPEGQGDVDEFCATMAQVPDWADGLPISVDGYRDKRFRG